MKTTPNGDVGMKCNFQEKTREGADQRVGRRAWGSSTWLAWQPGGVHAADYEVGPVMVIVMVMVMVKIVLVMKGRLMAVMVNRRRGLSLVIVVMVKRKTMMVVMVADMTMDQQPI